MCLNGWLFWNMDDYFEICVKLNPIKIIKADLKIDNESLYMVVSELLRISSKWMIK